MKKFLFLMSAIMMISISSFSQNNSSDLQIKYNTYLERVNAYHRSTKSTDKPLSYNDWLVDYLKSANPQISVDTQSTINTQSTQTPQIKTISLSPGDYLIKAKKLMITGYVLDIVGVGVICVSPNKTGIMAGGACGLIGLICELSGISNIGKAGVSFNQNGIGVKVKF